MLLTMRIDSAVLAAQLILVGEADVLGEELEGQIDSAVAGASLYHRGRNARLDTLVPASRFGEILARTFFTVSLLRDNILCDEVHHPAAVFPLIIVAVVCRRLPHDAPDISRRIGTCLVVHHQVVLRHLPPDSPGHTPAHRHLPRGAPSPGRASASATRPTGTRGRASAPATRCAVTSTTCGGCVIAATRSGHLARLLPRTPSSPSCSFPVQTHRRRRHHRASRSFERAFPPLQVSTGTLDNPDKKDEFFESPLLSEDDDLTEREVTLKRLRLAEEQLALLQHKLSLVNKARDFDVWCDHKPLQYAFSQAPEHAPIVRQRQLAYISQYTTSIKYLPGAENAVADALSRLDASDVSTHPPVDELKNAIFDKKRFLEPDGSDYLSIEIASNKNEEGVLAEKLTSNCFQQVITRSSINFEPKISILTGRSTIKRMNIVTDWYMKEISSQRTINFFSNHPEQLKINTVYNL
ncbi:unnamed protein product, partial [Trichogramma brassicae]